MASLASLTFGNTRFTIPSSVSPGHAKELRSLVRRALRQGDRRLTVDCQDWETLDLNVLSSLIQCASSCREHGASFEVANVCSEIRADVRALRLDDRLGLLD